MTEALPILRRLLLQTGHRDELLQRVAQAGVLDAAAEDALVDLTRAIDVRKKLDTQQDPLALAAIFLLSAEQAGMRGDRPLALKRLNTALKAQAMSAVPDQPLHQALSSALDRFCANAIP